MNKVVTLEKLKDICRLSTKANKTIGLCHGVFDLMHIGHIKYLEEAKKMCDVLVVTITEDKNVNKGPGRPYFNQKDRAQSIAGLACVNFVAINAWKTAKPTIKYLQPNLYIKGPDYNHIAQDPTENLLEEQQAIKSIGGEFVTTNTELSSSSKIINSHFETSKEIRDFRKRAKKKIQTDPKEIFDSFKNLKVLIVGESIIDKYIFCQTIGKAGKDPFLVSRKIRDEVYLGGALAGAKNLSDFVKEVKILSYLGENNEELQVVREGLGSKIKSEFIKKINSPTIIKNRFIDEYSNTKINGIYEINNELLVKKNENEFIKKLERNIKKYDIVIAMDFGHGLFTDKIARYISKNAKFLAVNIQQNSFNHGYYNIEKFQRANLFTLHEGEIRQHYRDKKSSTGSLVNKLSSSLNYKNIIVTQGNKGSLIKGENITKSLHCPALAKNIVDRVGSGDALLAISALSIFRGMTEEFTLLSGAIAASSVIEHHANSYNLNKSDLSNSVHSFLK